MALSTTVTSPGCPTRSWRRAAGRAPARRGPRRPRAEPDGCGRRPARRAAWSARRAWRRGRPGCRSSRRPSAAMLALSWPIRPEAALTRRPTARRRDPGRRDLLLELADARGPRGRAVRACGVHRAARRRRRRHRLRRFSIESRRSSRVARPVLPQRCGRGHANTPSQRPLASDAPSCKKTVQ